MKHFNLKRKKGLSRIKFNVTEFLQRRKLAREAFTPVQTNPITAKKFVQRKVFIRRNPRASMWWEYVLGGTWADPISRDGKLFRRRFRVSHEFFEGLVEKAKELFPDFEKKDGCGRQVAPIELKVLGVLRVLGRGVCFDDAAEGTNMNEETHRLFFHKFYHLFCRRYYPEYCRGPIDDDDLASTMSEYTTAGFAGCIGSTDGVHVSWDKCHAQQRQLHTGKEKYPTVAWNVTVNHRRWIMAVSKGFYGSYNDNTIVKYDKFITDIHEKKKYQDVTFTLHKRNGEDSILKGAWILCDGGYHRWRCMQCPNRDGSSLAERRWSKWAESLRKVLFVQWF